MDTLQDTPATVSENRPNYYAIIPADIRYDAELKPNEKLLYGEISALANRSGEAWASNRYFAELYGVIPNTIRTWIRHLEKRGYITTRYEYDGQEIKARYISIRPLPSEISIPPIKNNGTPPLKNKYHNNTSINNTSNNKYIVEIVDYLNQKAGKNFRASGAGTKHITARLADGYSIEELKTVIDIKTKEWKGTDMEKYLRPETLFNSAKFDGYLNQQKKASGGFGDVWT